MDGIRKAPLNLYSINQLVIYQLFRHECKVRSLTLYMESREISDLPRNTIVSGSPVNALAPNTPHYLLVSIDLPF